MRYVEPNPLLAVIFCVNSDEGDQLECRLPSAPRVGETINFEEYIGDTGYERRYRTFEVESVNWDVKAPHDTNPRLAAVWVNLKEVKKPE